MWELLVIYNKDIKLLKWSQQRICKIVFLKLTYLYGRKKNHKKLFFDFDAIYLPILISSLIYYYKERGGNIISQIKKNLICAYTNYYAH